MKLKGPHSVVPDRRATASADPSPGVLSISGCHAGPPRSRRRRLYRRLRRIPALVVAAAWCLLAVAAGCSDDDLMNHRRFILASIDGDPLPAVEHENVSGRYMALADTIVFTSPTRGFHTKVVRVEPSTAQPPETTRSTTEFTYESSSSGAGANISISYVCRDDVLADCLAGPHLSGTLGETTLTLRELHLSPDRERQYVRR